MDEVSVKRDVRKVALFALSILVIPVVVISSIIILLSPKKVVVKEPEINTSLVNQVEYKSVSHSGVMYNIPEKWVETNSSETFKEWDVVVNDKKVATVVFRKNNVQGLETPVDSGNARQEFEVMEGGLVKNKSVEVEGTTVTAEVEVTPPSSDDGYVFELVVPDQQNLSTEEVLEAHDEFEKVTESIAIVNELASDNVKAEVNLVKKTAKANGSDEALVSVAVSDDLLSNVIYFDISSVDPEEYGDVKVQAKAPMPTARINSAATVFGDNALVAGGVDYNTRLSASEIYNFTNNSWEETPPIAYRRDTPTLNFINGKGYLAGGYKDFEDIADDNLETGEFDYGYYDIMEVFDTETKTWSIGPKMLQPRAVHSSGVLDSKLYLFGGMTYGSPNCPGTNDSGNVEVFDPQSNIWVEESEAAFCGVSAQHAAYGNKLYYFGGLYPYEKLNSLSDEQLKDQKLVDEATISDEVYIYDLETKTIRKGSNMPHARMRGSAVEIDGLIYLLGGIKRHEKDIYDWRNEHIDVYNPETDTWFTYGAIFPTPIDFPAVSYENKIYTFGGDHLYSWPSSNAVWEIDLYQVIKKEEKVEGQPNQVNYSFKSLRPGTHNYRVWTTTSTGTKVLADFAITFE